MFTDPPSLSPVEVRDRRDPVKLGRGPHFLRAKTVLRVVTATSFVVIESIGKEEARGDGLRRRTSDMHAFHRGKISLARTRDLVCRDSHTVPTGRGHGDPVLTF